MLIPSSSKTQLPNVLFFFFTFTFIVVGTMLIQFFKIYFESFLELSSVKDLFKIFNVKKT